jgi:hypothetical protein
MSDSRGIRGENVEIRLRPGRPAKRANPNAKRLINAVAESTVATVTVTLLYPNTDTLCGIK